jgi:hypothetical protein
MEAEQPCLPSGFSFDVLGRYWDGMTCAPVAIKYRRQVADPDA